mmetsp:Transcript_4287/g.13430  ORF Transcript_4287/g.13430 Transcript_4287/m.13430 type:complete len:431 (+) Transcript_4287:2475-3767(+)
MFQILATDIHGNRCDYLGPSLSATRRGIFVRPNFVEFHANASLVGGVIDAQRTHQFSMTFLLDTKTDAARAYANPILAGTYYLDVICRMNQTGRSDTITDGLYGSPFQVEVVPSCVLAAKSYATGRGLRQGTAGTESKFTIVSVDALGNRHSLGYDALSVIAKYHSRTHLRQSQGDIVITGNIQDGGNSSYCGSVRPTVAGHYVLTVAIHGVDIQGSPFSLDVGPSYTEAGASSADWGLGLKRAIVNTAASFTVTARDRYGNPSVNGAALISCELISNVNGTCTSLGNGSALCLYTPALSGSGSLIVKYGDAHISGSPFQVLIGESAAAGNYSKSQGQGLFVAVAGEIRSLSICTHDVAHNSIDDTDAYHWKFNAVLTHQAFQAHQAASAVTTNAQNGIYTLEYLATLSGVYDLTITDSVLEIHPFLVSD